MNTYRLVILVCVLVAKPALADDRPNFLLIFSDDQGVHDVGCYGSEIPTPHIDSIAKGGVRFENWYVAAPVCTPSRYGLLTGLYPNRSKDQLLGPLMFLEAPDKTRGIHEGETTLATTLRQVGYDTALIGKWHLGHGHKKFLPTRHGFDHFYGHTGGCIDYFTKDYGITPDWYRGETHVREEGYATDLITKEAVRYLKKRSPKASDAASDKRKPFFLFLSYNAPHFGKGWDREKRTTTNILQARRDLLARFPSIKDPVRREFAAMVASLDDGIGEVLKALDVSGLTKDTLVIFMTDNGGDPRYGGSNKPLRGQKAQYFEGGIRVPCIVRWPGKIPAGKRSRQLASALDIFPTFCTLAGVDTSAMTLDGVDLGSHVLAGKGIRRDLFWQNGKQAAYRQGPWKYLRLPSGEEMLFDLERDPSETTNLTAADREVLEQLRRAHEKVAASFESHSAEPEKRKDAKTELPSRPFIRR